jgi:uncharacterized protein (DUF2147 family)
MQNRPIIGLKVLTNLKKSRHGWKGGRVYDPDSGSTYRAQAHLEGDSSLVVRGYIGIPLLGRSVTLKHVTDDTTEKIKSQFHTANAQ